MFYIYGFDSNSSVYIFKHAYTQKFVINGPFAPHI